MGQLGDSHYYCSYARVNWRKAQKEAAEIGGHLVVINSEEENEFIARRLIEREAYIGLHDQTTEGTYTWVNGDPLNYTKWKPSQPNGGESENVAEMDAQGYWYDVSGNMKREFVVEVAGCDQVTQIGGPEPGSKFRVGSTTITYRGEDGCGNVDTCSFEVILLPFIQDDAAEDEEPTAITRSVQSRIVIRPNPASDFIDITANTMLTGAQIFSIDGRLLKSWTWSRNSFKRLDVSDLSSGVHVLSVMSEDQERTTQKVVITR